ncbi:MAG: hypothetical protein ABI592_13680 [Acidobacteriota bacterium]
MKRHVLAVALVLGSALPAVAQQFGTASGKGTMNRSVPHPKSESLDDAYEKVSFSPRFSFAFREKKATETSTWIVFTEKQPPVKEALASNRLETLRLWCGKEKSSFIAMSLDGKMAPQSYFLCAGDARITSEGVNVANGLASIVVKFQTQTANRLKGTLRTGQGSCSQPDGPPRYCEDTGDFTFDAPIVR